MKGTGCTPNLCSFPSVPIPSSDSASVQKVVILWLFCFPQSLTRDEFPFSAKSEPVSLAQDYWQFLWGTQLWLVAVYSCFESKSWYVLWGFLFSQIFLKFMKFSPWVRPVWHLSKSFLEVLCPQRGTLMGRQPGTLQWHLAFCWTQSEKKNRMVYLILFRTVHVAH